MLMLAALMLTVACRPSWAAAYRQPAMAIGEYDLSTEHRCYRQTTPNGKQTLREANAAGGHTTPRP
jgi:hypothetical protein